MDDAGQLSQAKFHSMIDCTKEDLEFIGQVCKPFAMDLPDRVLVHFKLLAGDSLGLAVDRLEHCLQTATRAYRDERDEEYVVCALLHDIGDTIGCYNHADLAAAILKPFVSEQNLWMVEKHTIFQGYYFFHHLGIDRNLRDEFREHPWYDCAEEFCRLYDGPSFDPDYPSLPLDTFVPMVRRVFTNVRNSIFAPRNSPSSAEDASTEGTGPGNL